MDSFFIICLPLEFLPVSGPCTHWCASTLGAALLWFGLIITLRLSIQVVIRSLYHLIQAGIESWVARFAIWATLLRFVDSLKQVLKIFNFFSKIYWIWSEKLLSAEINLESNSYWTRLGLYQIWLIMFERWSFLFRKNHQIFHLRGLKERGQVWMRVEIGWRGREKERDQMDLSGKAKPNYKGRICILHGTV